jgi:hypothetical protein
MLDPRELRIGNLLLIGGRETEIIAIDKEGLNGYAGHDREMLYEHDFRYDDQHKVQPIPLAEEWLVKFGFENLESKTLFTKKFNVARVFSIVQHGYTGVFTYPTQNGVTIIQYVHQLQNLYFALTGEELKLKQEVK